MLRINMAKQLVESSKRSLIFLQIIATGMYLVFLSYLYTAPIAPNCLSIYTDLPLILWLIPAISLTILAFTLLAFLDTRKLEHCEIYQIISFCLILTIVLATYLFPYIRGALLVGSTQDCCGQLLHVYGTMYFGYSHSYYPGIINLITTCAIILGISPIQIAGILNGAIQVLVVLFAYCLGKGIGESRLFGILTALYAIVFQAITLEYSLAYLAGLALVPLTLTAWFYRGKSKSWMFILLILFVVLILFHPLIAFTIIIGLIFTSIALVCMNCLPGNIFKDCFTKIIPSKGPLLFSFIVYLLWNVLCCPFIINTPVELVESILFGDVGSSLEQVGRPASLGDYGYSFIDLIRLFIIVYFNNLVSILIIIIAYILSITTILKKGEVQEKVLTLQTLLVAIAGMVFINLIALISGSSSLLFRYLGFTGILSAPLFAYLFLSPIRKLGESQYTMPSLSGKKILMVLTLFLVSTAIMTFTLYSAPEFNGARSDVITESEIQGIKTTFAITAQYPIWVLYGDTRAAEIFSNTPPYDREYSRIRYQFALYNWYEKEYSKNQNDMYLFISQGRLLRSLYVNTPKDLALPASDCLAIEHNSHSNAILRNGAVNVYYICS